LPSQTEQAYWSLIGGYTHFLFIFFRQKPMHLDAKFAFLRRPYELYLLIPVQAAHHNEMMSPAVTE